MKANMIKMLVMAGLMIFLAQSEAMASATQVTFTVPVKIKPKTLGASTQVRCKIFRGGLPGALGLPGRAATVLGTGASTPVRNQRKVTVSVRAGRRMTFQKGDRWNCSLYYRGKFINQTGVADPKRSKSVVTGRF
ncbi:MAG: hypothetical protein GXP11_07480 [Gammaproteobacteria bacterium]|nr:hypothetical protein [Gammaproteobacteria bacterium]